MRLYKVLSYSLFFLITLEVLLFFLHVITGQDAYYAQFTYTYAWIGLLGAMAAFGAAKLWGGKYSSLGKALIYIGLAQFALFLGQNSCHFLRITEGLDKCPYPSFAEVFFVGSIFLYILGAYYLAVSMRVTNAIRDKANYKIMASTVALIMILLALYKFIDINELTSFADLFLLVQDYGFIYLLLELIYPFGAGLYTAIAILAVFASTNSVGSKLHWNCIFILIAFFMQFAGDTMYVWTDGLVSDGLYLTSFIFMSVSSLLFIGSAIDIKKSNGT